MGGARALIASLGASFSLVAGAALSLLIMSLVFAYDGFSGGVDLPRAGSAVVYDTGSTQAAPSRGKARGTMAAVVIRPAPPVARRAKRSAPAPSAALRTPKTTNQPAFNPGLRTVDPAPAPAPAAPTAPPAVGDGVRDVGDSVSATVQDTGKSASDATAPLLGPPVSQAVQDVLDLLTSVLQGATGAVGGVLDKAVPR
ncbi:MAG: hypothetical protein QOF65_2071 [Thermoleophilaceae bacterium]|jgi:hypothetical protein|nr:hypothetical protein [Thermoleophilaceae bacterium]